MAGTASAAAAGAAADARGDDGSAAAAAAAVAASAWAAGEVEANSASTSGATCGGDALARRVAPDSSTVAGGDALAACLPAAAAAAGAAAGEAFCGRCCCCCWFGCCRSCPGAAALLGSSSTTLSLVPLQGQQKNTWQHRVSAGRQAGIALPLDTHISRLHSRPDDAATPACLTALAFALNRSELACCTSGPTASASTRKRSCSSAGEGRGQGRPGSASEGRQRQQAAAAAVTGQLNSGENLAVLVAATHVAERPPAASTHRAVSQPVWQLLGGAAGDSQLDAGLWLQHPRRRLGLQGWGKRARCEWGSLQAGAAASRWRQGVPALAPRQGRPL